MTQPPRSVLSRRALVAGGLGSGLLLIRPSLLQAAEPADLSKIQPQPYFAGVNRALAAMTRLGAPPSAADRQRITALARRNEAHLVGDPLPPATIDFRPAPLTGVAQESRALRVTLREPGATDLTIAFKARNEAPDLGGRDRVHFLMRCF